MNPRNDVFDSAAPEIFQVRTRASGSEGSLPLTGSMLLNSPSGDLVRADAKRRHGLESGGSRAQTISDPQHPGRVARARRQAHRPRLSHRALGSRTARAGRGRGIPPVAGHPLCRLLFRSLRWPDPGHGGHVRQPAVSQRCRADFPAAGPVAAAAGRSAGHRHLRQGAARDDDGGGGPARSARRGRPRRRHAAAGGGRRCRHGADLGHALCARLGFTGGGRRVGLPRVRLAGRGCQFLGTAATAQVVGEALGLSLPHSALAPSGQPVWLDLARRSARALASPGRAQAGRDATF